MTDHALHSFGALVANPRVTHQLTCATRVLALLALLGVPLALPLGLAAQQPAPPRGPQWLNADTTKKREFTN